jgi:hypothetical protein
MRKQEAERDRIAQTDKLTAQTETQHRQHRQQRQTAQTDSTDRQHSTNRERPDQESVFGGVDIDIQDLDQILLIVTEGTERHGGGGGRRRRRG